MNVPWGHCPSEVSPPSTQQNPSDIQVYQANITTRQWGNIRKQLDPCSPIIHMEDGQTTPGPTAFSIKEEEHVNALSFTAVSRAPTIHYQMDSMQKHTTIPSFYTFNFQP